MSEKETDNIEYDPEHPTGEYPPGHPNDITTKIKWYNPMRREIEEKLKNGITEEDMKQVWFVEQIKNCFMGEKPKSFEEWKRNNF
jgi:hypothetical protein